jgi:hypothetical protein
MNIHDVFHV